MKNHKRAFCDRLLRSGFAGTRRCTRRAVVMLCGLNLCASHAGRSKAAPVRTEKGER